MLLTASDEALSAEPPHRFASGWVGVVLLSIAWGLANVALWDAAGKVFNWYYGIPLMPAAAVVVGMTLWMYRRSFLALGDLLGGEGPGRLSASAVLIVVLVLSLLGLKRWDEDYPSHLPEFLRWLHPGASYRVLILMPVWGAWGMLVTSKFCRPNDRTEPSVASFAAGCGPLATAGCMGALLAVTILEFNFLPWWQLSISGATIAAAVFGGILLCRRAGGLTRQALLAVNLLTQLTFLVAYLANR